MKKKLICPIHKCTLTKTPDGFHCSCGDFYPIIKEIPRFVAIDNYSNSFGEQWNRFLTTQLDSHTKREISESRLKRCLGREWNNLSGSTVLECGCGAGRFTEILLRQGARVYSIDYSSAVEANKKNFPLSENHKIYQADILNLPFAPKQFDFVICLGVIQHTPNSEDTIRALYSYVKDGGWLIVDHYRYLLSWYLHPAPIFRFFLKRYSRNHPQNAMRFVEKMVNLLFPIHWLFWKKSKPLHWLLNRFSPVITYFDTFEDFTLQQHKEWSYLDTHDSLTDWFKARRTVNQIERTLSSEGLENIQVWYGGNGVEARGQRPCSLFR